VGGGRCVVLASSPPDPPAVDKPAASAVEGRAGRGSSGPSSSLASLSRGIWGATGEDEPRRERRPVLCRRYQVGWFEIRDAVGVEKIDHLPAPQHTAESTEYCTFIHQSVQPSPAFSLVLREQFSLLRHGRVESRVASFEPLSPPIFPKDAAKSSRQHLPGNVVNVNTCCLFNRSPQSPHVRRPCEPRGRASAANNKKRLKIPPKKGMILEAAAASFLPRWEGAPPTFGGGGTPRVAVDGRWPVLSAAMIFSVVVGWCDPLVCVALHARQVFRSCLHGRCWGCCC
jgi:hypothetical protein